MVTQNKTQMRSQARTLDNRLITLNLKPLLELSCKQYYNLLVNANRCHLVVNILSAEEYWQVREESIKTNGKLLLNYDGFDEIEQRENQFSTDLVHRLELRPGLDMTIGKHIHHADLNYVSPYDGVPYPLISKFHISGTYRTITPGIKEISNDYANRKKLLILFTKFTRNPSSFS